MSSSDAGSKSTPSKSVRSRVGSLMRRSSTALSFTRPGVASRRSSSESLAVDTHQPLAPPEALIGHKLPSPVPESPAVVPTPIASPTPVQASQRPATPSAPINIPVKTPPPHNNWGDGPVTLTPSAISSPAVTARSEDVAGMSVAADDTHSSVAELQAGVEDEISMDGVPAAIAHRVEDDPAPPYMAERDSQQRVNDEREAETAQGHEEPAAGPERMGADVERTADEGAPEPLTSSNGDEPVNSTNTPPASDIPPGVASQPVAIDFASVEGSGEPIRLPSIHDVPTLHSSPTSDMNQQPAFAEDSIEAHSPSEAEDDGGGRSRGSTVSSQARPITPPATFTHTSASAKTSIAPSAEHTAPIVIVDTPHGNTSTSSIRLYDDPFADPELAPETSTRVYSPDRAAFQSPMDAQPSDNQSIHTIPVPIAMPVAPAPIGVQGGWQWNDTAGPGYVNDERLPLLRNPSQAPSETVAFPEPVRVYGTTPPSDLSFERLGWLMHVLPDTTVYFTHPGLSITTDIDLRTEGAIRDVSRYLGGPRVRPPPGWELWLRSTGKLSARAPDHSFVHHERRMVVAVSYEPEPIEPSSAELLALQASYWTYIEKHPAHVILSPMTAAEAMDILTWAYTDRLLPPEARERIPPFNQDECHELSAILRSLDANPSPNQVAIRTRVIAKIMLRICRWKQGRVSVDGYERRLSSRSTVQPSFVRRAADVAIYAVCMGVPYLFVDRSRSRREYESGMRSTAGSMLVVGAVACMIAAVILGASVTLISIPGLNDISRIASFISIILSASSLVSALLALFRWKTDIERNAYHDIGQEGFMVINRRSVLLSLPLVFLIWAIAAFVVGVALHMLRGLVLPRHVGKYMQWVVVGTVGGLAGMLFACGLLLL